MCLRGGHRLERLPEVLAVKERDKGISSAWVIASRVIQRVSHLHSCQGGQAAIPESSFSSSSQS